MSKLQPFNLYTTAQGAALRRVVATDSAGVRTMVDPVEPSNAAKRYTLTPAEWQALNSQAAAVMLASSGGITDYRCFDTARQPSSTPPPIYWKYSCRPAGTGYDRGLWAFNSKTYGPGTKYALSDALADDPEQSTNAAYILTNGWRDWAPFAGSAGLDKTGAAATAVAADVAKGDGYVVDNTPGPGSTTDLLGWAAGLGKLLSFVTSSSFWRRVGIGALGVVLVYEGVHILTGSGPSITEAATSAVKLGAIA